jgi:hypothetical protein
MPDELDESPPWPVGGFSIRRGMTVRIPAGGLRIDLNKSDMSLTLHSSLALYPYWLEIALTHLERAREAHQQLLVSWKNQDKKQASRHLEADFTESVQCIVASAIAVDAFYAIIKRHVAISGDISAA